MNTGIARLLFLKEPVIFTRKAVAKTSSKGSSLRITIPKEIEEKLNISESEHIGFYEVEGEILIRKIS